MLVNCALCMYNVGNKPQFNKHFDFRGVAEGNTGCNCSCPMTYKKVLGEDNKWYMNKCVMECA